MISKKSRKFLWVFFTYPMRIVEGAPNGTYIPGGGGRGVVPPPSLLVDMLKALL